MHSLRSHCSHARALKALAGGRRQHQLTSSSGSARHARRTPRFCCQAGKDGSKASTPNELTATSLVPAPSTVLPTLALVGVSLMWATYGPCLRLLYTTPGAVLLNHKPAQDSTAFALPQTASGLGAPQQLSAHLTSVLHISGCRFGYLWCCKRHKRSGQQC
jgi:hypothetical protein